MHYGVKLYFGQAIPAQFIIRTYCSGAMIAERMVESDEIFKSTVLYDRFDDFDTMTIEFTKTAEPYSRIVLNNLILEDVTDFTMTRTDMISSPKAFKQELVKEVIVPTYVYQSDEKEETLISEDVTVTVGETEIFFMDEPYYNFRIVLDEQTENVTITEWGNYYVTVRFNVAGTFRLEIFGHRYKIIERCAAKTLHIRGKTVRWENPLMSDMAMANELAEWLGDYYESGIEYEYTTRGNPELDVNDIIYQENEFRDNMKVNVYRQRLTFDQSFSGKVTARRIGG